MFNEDGTFVDGENEFVTKQTNGFLNQLAWWAEACKEQRKKVHRKKRKSQQTK